MNNVINMSDYRFEEWHEVMTYENVNSTLQIYINDKTGELDIVQMNDDNEAIYLNGAYGQRIAISPNKQRIMIVFSYKENYMGELYKLFASW